MSAANATRWLLAPPANDAAAAIIGWWEARRIAYNAIVIVAAAVSYVLFLISISTAGALEPGEDAVEPIALIFGMIVGPIAWNICYTAGWVVDVPLRTFWPLLSGKFTVRLFALGLCFSVLVVSFPALFWGGYRLLQLIHII